MTRALAFTKLVEDSNYFVHPETRNLTGSIGDLAEFQSQLDAFADAFDGLYCFLAFHPAVDKAIAEYVTAGSLARLRRGASHPRPVYLRRRIPPAQSRQGN